MIPECCHGIELRLQANYNGFLPVSHKSSALNEFKLFRSHRIAVCGLRTRAPMLTYTVPAGNFVFRVKTECKAHLNIDASRGGRP
jgi:hypothetical protein